MRLLLLLFASSLPWLPFARATAQAPSIPIVQGLTIVGAVHEPRGDYEVTEVVKSVTPDVIELVVTARVPIAANSDSSRQMVVTRLIRQADVRTAHKWTADYATDDPPMFAGATAEGISTAMLNELTTSGSSAVVLGIINFGEASLPGPFGGGRKYYRGDLHRVEAGVVPIPVLVNGVRISLPTIHVRGHLTVGSDEIDPDMYILNDPALPLNIKGGKGWTSGQVTEIEWAQPDAAKGAGAGGAPRAMASALAGKSCRTEVHGIYFAFGSASLLPESDLMLRQVAAVLKENSTWNVTIEGHTDSIGGHQSNLDLSKRRAAAVSAALSAKYGVPASRLSTAGLGDTRPIESNATIEGRARNRRVEMARKC